jgi:uncharacterized protein (TIGR03437 family)
MFNPGSNLRSSLTTLFASVAILTSAHPLAAQTTVTQFIASVEASITKLTASLPQITNDPLIFGGQNIFAYGSAVANATPQELNDYADGLKASGVQRLEFNPSVTAINNAKAAANYDAMVRHVRQLGMQLAINPEVLVGEFTSFQDFQTMAMQTYPQMAARFKPDNFVIVHEPTTMAARMTITTTPGDWDAFIRAVEPLIKAASPRTQVGAGDCSHCNEEAFFVDFVAIPTCTAANLTSGCLDFMTMDLYSNAAADFTEDAGWAQAAHAAGKGVYMEETFAPHFFSGAIPPGFQGNAGGLESVSTIGSANAIFTGLDQDWIKAMVQFDMANGMESITPFTTQTFFLYVTSGSDKATDPAYLKEVQVAVQQGQLTPMATAYLADMQQFGIKTATTLNNASYATMPTVFNPTCGTAANPCNPDSTVAPDMLASAFGADLAKEIINQSNFPNSLGNTTAALIDSTNTTYTVPLYSVAPTQVNYLVPSNVASGPAKLTITSGDGAVTTGIVLVAPVAPGLYTISANGQGAAAAIAVCSGVCSGWPNQLSNGQFWQYTYSSGCASGTCTAPLTLAATDTVVIEFYGTGIRHLAQASDITATIGSTNLPVQFAGAQGSDTGLDQINVLIPQSLAGAGQVTLTVTTKDNVNNVSVTSNAVALNLQ